MTNPFVYPAERHRRRITPKQYKSYKTYKKYLRAEFSKQCVYCRMPDGMRGSDSFGVDHYRPKEKFPELAVAYENLFYACSACNSRKGDYWPSAEESTRGVFVPNPCDHKMGAHARYRIARVEGRSVAGKWLIELMQLNDERVVGYRSVMLTTIKALESRLVEIETNQRQVRRTMESLGAAKRGRLQTLADQLESERAALKESLLFFTSGP